MNNVVLYGRMTKDVEIKYTQSAEPLAVGRFSIAVNRAKKANGEQETDFINCVAFGKTAENISKYFTKGSRILVNGRLQVSSYNDQQGNKRYSTDVVIEKFDFIETKAEKSNSSVNTNDNLAYFPTDINDDDVPF